MSELNKVKLEETNRGKHSISDSLQDVTSFFLELCDTVYMDNI